MFINFSFFIKRDVHLVLSKSLLYELIFGRDIHKGLIFLVSLQSIKNLKSFLGKETLLDTTILLISIFSIEIELLWFQDNFPLDNPNLTTAPRAIPTQDNCPLTIRASDYSHLGQLPPGQFLPRTIVLPQIITPRQLLPRAMTITNYNFFMAIFCFFFMDQLYNFCYDS